MAGRGRGPGGAAQIPARRDSAGMRGRSRRSSEAPAQSEPGGAASGAEDAADVGEGVLDLLTQRGEDEHHHDADQHQDQGVLSHTLPILTAGEAAVQRTARHFSQAEKSRGDPSYEFSGSISI